MYIRSILPAGVAAIALLAGCATPVSTKIQPTPENVAKYRDLTDINVVATLEKNVNEAKVAGMPFLAPNYFKEASGVLSDCKNQLGNQPKDVLARTAAKGDAILDKGRAVMAIVKYRFAQELELRTRLDALDAAKLLPNEYKNVMASFSSLVEMVEREQPGNIDKKKEALVKALQDLEVKVVQQGALHEAEAINAESKKNGAEKQAPVTYAEALRVYEDAKKQIAAAPRDDKLVQRLGGEALFAARHAQQVNIRVSLLISELNVVSTGTGVSVSTMAGGAGAAAGVAIGGRSGQADKMSAEKIVLQEEDRLHSIADALGLKDMRDLALGKQVDEMKRAAGELARQPKGAARQEQQELEARLKAADDATQRAKGQLAAKEQQLADKDAQVATLQSRVAELEAAAQQAKPAVKAAKPKAAAKPRAAKQKAS